MDVQAAVLSLVPKTCPKCNAPTFLNKDMTSLRCTNNQCAAKRARKLEIAAKLLGIKFMGPSVCEILADNAAVSNPELFQQIISRGLLSDALSPVSQGIAIRVYAEVLEKAYEPVEDWMCIAMTSPESVGSETSKVLLEAFGSLEGVLEANATAIQARCAGTGERKANNICAGISEQAEEIREYRKMFQSPTAKVKLSHRLTGQKICVTGEVPGHSRDQVRILVELNGGVWASGVSKTTTLLVAADPDSGTTKIKAAKKNGTKVVSPEEFLEMAGGSLSKEVRLSKSAISEPDGQL